jgi:transposase
MSLKNPSTTRRKYDQAFKEDVLKMVASGRSIRELSKALGISTSVIHRWYKSSDQLAGHTISPEGNLTQSSLASENERLKAELRRTEQERDILKKALGIFSRTP